jgi:hypothetical protein
MTRPNTIDEQTLLYLGFERYTEEWEPEGWVLDLPGGRAEYANSKWDGQWKLRLWSGTGGGDTYGFEIESPSEEQLQSLLEAMAE